MQNRLPFTLSKNESFTEKLSQWVGDVFYDILPEAGFELRDEQIYMAFQLEKAFKEKKVMFAEAGVGTGKTIVYLLYAICYARYTNRPAIIACADESLIEQLVKKEGDIAKLEKVLHLNIDVRLAKSREQYLCLKKLEKAVFEMEAAADIYDRLPDFVFDDLSMQKFTPYGDRKDYPELTDEEWEKVAWDPLQDCFTCDRRHRCGQTLYRDYYRGAKDLIVCSQDFFMEHIWTKESRKREGQLPLLPESCCVVFDEGHLLEYACQKALTYRLEEMTLESLLERLMSNDVREATLYAIEEAIEHNVRFFELLKKSARKIVGSEKQAIEKTVELTEAARKLKNSLEKLLDELVFDSEMYVIDEYELKIVEEHLDQIVYSLSLFIRELKGILWFEEKDGQRTLVIMPRMVEEFMREEVFSQRKPYIFSSATLSDHKSFTYLANSLGISDYLSFSVPSPFDYDRNMKIFMPLFPEGSFEEKMRYAKEQLLKTGGRGLVLFSNQEELQMFKKFLNDVRFSVYAEGDAEISTLVANFQREEDSVLLSMNLWEGLDVPGPALENLIVFNLPFPPHDPVFEAKRETTADPFHDVDLPYMLLRLKQGVGRLIRTREDKGQVHILAENSLPAEVYTKIKNILPTKISE